MKTHTSDINSLAKSFGSDVKKGLKQSQAEENLRRYGANVVSENKKKSLFSRLLGALSEPTLVILEFAWVITVGVNVGKYLKSGSCDVYECIGIFVAIFLSVALTVYMEGRSERAFELLGKNYDKISVKVVRDGKVTVVPKESIATGDLVLVETGDKIVADGRLVESNGLVVDESTLTGESAAVKKDAYAKVDVDAPLAERRNSLYSGTFVSAGMGKMLVTATGDNAELGKIATELVNANSVSAPLNEKLARLGKKITLIGAICSALAFALSVIKLVATGDVNFFSVQESLIGAIVLIVAAVPEGLPTTAAISLSLSVLKLAKSNALIRKLVAAETVGCVSVICSDKTGTLTENKMSVEKIRAVSASAEDLVYINSAVNSTAEIKFVDGQAVVYGSATEGALLKRAKRKGFDYAEMRKIGVGKVVPFSSEYKYMSTVYLGKTYLKGAPEVVLDKCKMLDKSPIRYLNEMRVYQEDGKRVVAFASGYEGNLTFDGYAVISDPVRGDVTKAVSDCKRAGIRVIIMTGDNSATARSVAARLGLLTYGGKVVTATELESLSSGLNSAALKDVAVIARSTPHTKLAVVEALKRGGEVVAVTGDGVNDAPAIKHADIGISMGSGSEITKEASDVVLLDDSFSTIVKAVAFGRNVYRNFQRFITFQLTVNATSMIVVIVSLLLGAENPFNAVQLLWIDIIMDGPPALTLALEPGDGGLLGERPVRRTDEILTKNMLLRILLHGVYAASVILLELRYDFLSVGSQRVATAAFCLFVVFQTFNAFNCRKFGDESAFKGLSGNKAMLIAFATTLAFQIVLTQFFGEFFKIIPLSACDWVKIALIASSTVVISEVVKLVCRVKNRDKKRRFIGVAVN